MNVLTANAGSPGEQVGLLTQQGEPFPVALQTASSLASSVPLSSVLYVDGASTATGTPNGSAANPFLTLQAAVDASVDQGTIYVCWTAAGYLEAVDCGSKQLQIIGVGIGENETPMGAIVVTSFITGVGLALQNIQTGAVETTFSQLDLVDCNIQGSGSGISCSNLVATARRTGTIAKPISCSGGAKLHNYSVSGSFSGPEYVATSDVASELDGNVQSGVIDATAGVSLKGLAISANITGDTVQIEDCSIDAAITITATGDSAAGPILRIWQTSLGDPTHIVTLIASVESNTLEIDTFTKQWLKNAVTSTFGLVRVNGALAQETISVVVPAVGAGNVGYADCTPAGELAGVTTADLVQANPTADLVAAGAGGGYLNCRVSAPNTIRLAFIGPLAGGSVNFLFARLSRSAFP